MQFQGNTPMLVTPTATNVFHGTISTPALTGNIGPASMDCSGFECISFEVNNQANTPIWWQLWWDTPGPTLAAYDQYWSSPGGLTLHQFVTVKRKNLQVLYTAQSSPVGCEIQIMGHRTYPPTYSWVFENPPYLWNSNPATGLTLAAGANSGPLAPWFDYTGPVTVWFATPYTTTTPGGLLSITDWDHNNTNQGIAFQLSPIAQQNTIQRAWLGHLRHLLQITNLTAVSNSYYWSITPEVQ
jgi:hypothetical protein